ncbi:DUF4352 domain-containing protein [Streptomyces bacillaris]|uniref:DUF4352 domain-containing protein n=1 Tax=Streptomyces bacillaris TaxID=68179 RepID=UPI0037FBF56F
MRRTIIAVIAAAGLLLTATACTDDEITTAPSKTGAAEESKKAEPTEPAAEEEAEKPSKDAKVGDTIALKGNEGEKVDAVLKKWVDDAKSADEFFKPADGKRWVAAQFELTNTGEKPYVDSPSNGAQVADAEGQRFGATFADIADGPSMTSDANVPQGEKVLGWIVFEVPKTSKVVTVQFALSSGFASQTGQWKVS